MRLGGYFRRSRNKKYIKKYEKFFYCQRCSKQGLRKDAREIELKNLGIKIKVCEDCYEKYKKK